MSSVTQYGISGGVNTLRAAGGVAAAFGGANGVLIVMEVATRVLTIIANKVPDRVVKLVSPLYNKIPGMAYVPSRQWSKMSSKELARSFCICTLIALIGGAVGDYANKTAFKKFNYFLSFFSPIQIETKQWMLLKALKKIWGDKDKTPQDKKPLTHLTPKEEELEVSLTPTPPTTTILNTGSNLNTGSPNG